MLRDCRKRYRMHRSRYGRTYAALQRLCTQAEPSSSRQRSLCKLLYGIHLLTQPLRNKFSLFTAVICHQKIWTKLWIKRKLLPPSTIAGSTKRLTHTQKSNDGINRKAIVTATTIITPMFKSQSHTTQQIPSTRSPERAIVFRLSVALWSITSHIFETKRDMHSSNQFPIATPLCPSSHRREYMFFEFTKKRVLWRSKFSTVL